MRVTATTHGLAIAGETGYLKTNIPELASLAVCAAPGLLAAEAVNQ